jgi:hypothetical protein
LSKDAGGYYRVIDMKYNMHCLLPPCFVSLLRDGGEVCSISIMWDSMFVPSESSLIFLEFFFRTTREIEYLLFFFFPEFNIRLYDKNSESD